MRQKLSPADNRRAWLWATLIVLMMLALGAGVYLLVTHERTEAPFLPDESAMLIEASAGLDSIRIDAAFDPEGRQLTVTQEMTLRNRTGQDQAAVMLRSWSGAYLAQETSPAASDELYYACYPAGFDPGGLKLEKAFVNGSVTIWHWLDEAQTVLSLPAAWAEGSQALVRLQYTVEIPRCASRFGYADGFFMLGNVFPVPALWQDGAWRTDAYAAIGDPFLSECANWEVALTVPDGYTAAASVWDEPSRRNGQLHYDFSGKALRDFALVISDHFHCAQGMAGDTLVTACAGTQQDAEAMLRCAIQALDSYGKRWGSYAYPTFTLAEAPFPYGGMEYPGMVMIASDMIAANGILLEYVVAHETAHQWWAVMVGSDGWYQPWQDESLCEYAWLDYVGDWYGADARSQMAFDRIETAMRITIPGGATPGSPLDRFSDLTQYSRIVYQRGAAFWCAMEIHLGKDGLDAMLCDYQARFCFRIATREDLTSVLSQHAGMDMSGLMLDYLDTLMP